MKTFIYFSAPWCGPCQNYSPIMEEIGRTMPVQKVNIDEQQDVVSHYNVKSIPTTLIIKDGVEVWRQLGVTTKSNLEFAYNNS
jgi:thioredoxin 1